MIVSGALSDSLVPAVTLFPQVNCLAIYCYDGHRHERHSNDDVDRPVQLLGVFTELNPLLEAVRKRIDGVRRSLSTISPLSWLKSENHGQTSVKDLSEENALFVWFQLFIETLFRLPRTDQARQKMLEECARQYADNDVQLT